MQLDFFINRLYIIKNNYICNVLEDLCDVVLKTTN